MRNLVVILFAAAALAGCGGGGDACGGTDQKCCANNACNVAGNTCQGGICKAAAMCGKVGLNCCPGNVCSEGTCTNGKCAMAQTCGASGQPCCAMGAMCNTGLVCNAGTCGMMMGGNTGDPCTKNTDCAGTKPVCITKDTQGITWPGGYCTSQCNPTKNDQNGLNTACPGGTGTCLGNGTTGACETACTDMAGAMPCPRMGYSCFQGCEPTARSECDPTKSLSCPQDGGAPLMAGGTSPRTCAKIGTDAVGTCTNGCDPLAMQSVDMPSEPCVPNKEGCYPSYFTGEGTCFQTVAPAQGTGDEGMPCMYLNNCLPGLSCHGENNTAVCRHMCRTGMNAVACPIVNMKQQACMKLFAQSPVPTDTLGLCQ